jgi:hypothetical protein
MIAIVITIIVVIVDLEKTCTKMKNPPKTKIELINLEVSDEDPFDLVMKSLDSEDSDSYDEDYDVEDYGEGTSRGIPMFTEASEIISRAHSFIAHEQETLDEKLDEIIYEFEGSTEYDMLQYLRKCFDIIDDSITWANQFLDQAIEKQIDSFTGFYYEMHDDADIAITKTLTIISLLEEKNFFSLIPVVEDLTSEIDQIKVIVSNTTLEQVEETLKNYASKRSLNRRKIEDFLKI